MRTRVSYLAEKLASGELSACQVLDKCIDIDRARDVFELAELFRFLNIRDQFEDAMKLNEERIDWNWFQEDYFQDTNWVLNNTDSSWINVWADYDLAEQERLSPSDREILIGKLARELARKKLSYSDYRVWPLIARFYKEYGLTPKEQVIFTDEYVSECSRIQGL